jgi:hypothetical protein
LLLSSTNFEKETNNINKNIYISFSAKEVNDMIKSNPEKLILRLKNFEENLSEENQLYNLSDKGWEEFQIKFNKLINEKMSIGLKKKIIDNDDFKSKLKDHINKYINIQEVYIKKAPYIYIYII